MLDKNMKTLELPDVIEFDFKDCEVCGDPCWLITPNHININWTDKNARFRSCIIRKSDNFVISQGFPKFTNFGEKPAFQPWNESWPVIANTKLDGSLLIVSKYKDELIIRTRGTVNARQLPNGHEIDLLIQKYPYVFNKDIYNEYTFLFEWTTPSNIIVIKEHSEPTLTLIGGINNETAELMSNLNLDILAISMSLERPKKHQYNSISECIADVSLWKGKEGIVLSSPDGQTLKKIKSTEYCELHRLASGLKSVNAVIDVFIQSPKFIVYEEFYCYVETLLDYEIAQRCKDHIRDVVENYLIFCEQKVNLNTFVDTIRDLPSRKDQAFSICENFTDWRRQAAFMLLDNKSITDTFVSNILKDKLKINS